MLCKRMMRSALLGALTVGTALAQSPPPTPDPAKAEDRSGQSQKGQQQPVEQQDTVHPRNSKDDVEAVGNRKVGKGPNFYSLEKEITLGKQLVQDVERSSRLIDDPVVTEYVKLARPEQQLANRRCRAWSWSLSVLQDLPTLTYAERGRLFASSC
jgi:hypothetical protein